MASIRETILGDLTAKVGDVRNGFRIVSIDRTTRALEIVPDDTLIRKRETWLSWMGGVVQPNAAAWGDGGDNPAPFLRTESGVRMFSVMDGGRGLQARQYYVIPRPTQVVRYTFAFEKAGIWARNDSPIVPPQYPCIALEFDGRTTVDAVDGSILPEGGFNDVRIRIPIGLGDLTLEKSGVSGATDMQSVWVSGDETGILESVEYFEDFTDTLAAVSIMVQHITLVAKPALSVYPFASIWNADGTGHFPVAFGFATGQIVASEVFEVAYGEPAPPSVTSVIEQNSALPVSSAAIYKRIKELESAYQTADADTQKVLEGQMNAVRTMQNAMTSLTVEWAAALTKVNNPSLKIYSTLESVPTDQTVAIIKVGTNAAHIMVRNSKGVLEELSVLVRVEGAEKDAALNAAVDYVTGLASVAPGVSGDFKAAIDALKATDSDLQTAVDAVNTAVRAAVAKVEEISTGKTVVGAEVQEVATYTVPKTYWAPTVTVSNSDGSYMVRGGDVTAVAETTVMNVGPTGSHQLIAAFGTAERGRAMVARAALPVARTDAMISIEVQTAAGGQTLVSSLSYVNGAWVASGGTVTLDAGYAVLSAPFTFSSADNSKLYAWITPGSVQYPCLYEATSAALVRNVTGFKVTDLKRQQSTVLPTAEKLAEQIAAATRYVPGTRAPLTTDIYPEGVVWGDTTYGTAKPPLWLSKGGGQWQSLGQVTLSKIRLDYTGTRSSWTSFSNIRILKVDGTTYGQIWNAGASSNASGFPANGAAYTGGAANPPINGGAWIELVPRAGEALAGFSGIIASYRDGVWSTVVRRVTLTFSNGYEQIYNVNWDNANANITNTVTPIMPFPIGESVAVADISAILARLTDVEARPASAPYDDAPITARVKTLEDAPDLTVTYGARTIRDGSAIPVATADGGTISARMITPPVSCATAAVILAGGGGTVRTDYSFPGAPGDRFRVRVAGRTSAPSSILRIDGNEGQGVQAVLQGGTLTSDGGGTTTSVDDADGWTIVTREITLPASLSEIVNVPPTRLFFSVRYASGFTYTSPIVEKIEVVGAAAQGMPLAPLSALPNLTPYAKTADLPASDILRTLTTGETVQPGAFRRATYNGVELCIRYAGAAARVVVADFRTEFESGWEIISQTNFIRIDGPMTWYPKNYICIVDDILHQILLSKISDPSEVADYNIWRRLGFDTGAFFAAFDDYMLKFQHSTTAEVLTGEKWTDGKDIYRRVYTGTMPTATGDSTLFTVTGATSVVRWTGKINQTGTSRQSNIDALLSGDAAHGPAFQLYNPNVFHLYWSTLPDARFRGPATYSVIVDYVK